MLETIQLSQGEATREWGGSMVPSVDDLRKALGRVGEVEDAEAIIKSAWVEVEVAANRLWGMRSVTHDFRLLEGSTARLFPVANMPSVATTTLSIWVLGAGWEDLTSFDILPDGTVEDLTEGAFYRARCVNLGLIPVGGPPAGVRQAVLRLSAWRASHGGGMYRHSAQHGAVPIGMAQANGIIKSGAWDCLQPHASFRGNQ